MSQSPALDLLDGLAAPPGVSDLAGFLPDVSGWGLAGGILFGLIGWMMIRQARQHGEMLTLLCGVGLMFYPLLVYNTFWIFAVGITLTAIPFVAARL
jgi:hypothetical protein